MVEAYLQSADRSDHGNLDMDEVTQWSLLAASGASSWENIMASASSDAVRLALVDTTATVVVGTRHYLDDQKTKIASRAQAVHTLNIIKDETAKQGECIRFEKSKIIARFQDQLPVGSIQFSPSHKTLGFIQDEHRSGQEHLRHMEAEHQRLLSLHLRVLTRLDAKLELALLVYTQCTQQAALHCAELLAHRHDFEVRMNAMQAQAARSLLYRSCRLPRALLLSFLGWSERASTKWTVRAAMLWFRAHSDPRYLDAVAVFNVARAIPTTWSNFVCEWLAKLAPGLPDRRIAQDGMTPAQRKYELQKLRKEVIPPLAAKADQRWWACPTNVDYIARMANQCWTLTHVPQAPLRACQVWAQLCLQGHLTVPTDAQLPCTCRLCHRQPETSDHILIFCVETEKIYKAWLRHTPAAQRYPSRFAFAQYILGLTPADSRSACAAVLFVYRWSCAANSQDCDLSDSDSQ